MTERLPDVRLPHSCRCTCAGTGRGRDGEGRGGAGLVGNGVGGTCSRRSTRARPAAESAPHCRYSSHTLPSSSGFLGPSLRGPPTQSERPERARVTLTLKPSERPECSADRMPNSSATRRPKRHCCSPHTSRRARSPGQSLRCRTTASVSLLRSRPRRQTDIPAPPLGEQPVQGVPGSGGAQRSSRTWQLCAQTFPVCLRMPGAQE